MTLKEFFTTDIEATVFKYKNYVILITEIMKIIKKDNADSEFANDAIEWCKKSSKLMIHAVIFYEHLINIKTYENIPEDLLEQATKTFEDGYPLLLEIEEQLKELTQEIN